MKAKILILLPVLFYSAGTFAQDTLIVKAGQLKSWCFTLASDSMKGRRNGSPEMKQAAEFIASEFRKAGLKSFPGHPGLLQEYTYMAGNNLEIRERNVIGYIEGSDSLLKQEWIILSAHFDHIGIRQAVNGDSIYNGANDNASGTATLMGVAATLAARDQKPGRSILFAAFSGEENGMRGSRWFLGNAPVPMEQVRLNLNFEMEGESATLGARRYLLTGDRFTDFDELLDRYNEGTNWSRAREYRSPAGVFFSSDNAVFAVKREGSKRVLNIPAFTLVTTDDLNIIHKVTDEAQFMDYQNMESLVHYLGGLVLHLSKDPLKISWNQQEFDAFFQPRK